MGFLIQFDFFFFVLIVQIDTEVRFRLSSFLDFFFLINSSFLDLVFDENAFISGHGLT